MRVIRGKKAEQLRFETLEQRFQDLKEGVEMVVGRFQGRSGRKLEDIIASALRLALQRPDLRPDQIRLRQKMVDTEGVVFPRGRWQEVDVIVSDGEYPVFEVKSAAEVEDVDDFADKLRLFGHLHPDKTVGGYSSLWPRNPMCARVVGNWVFGW